jgi:hypothetical protein
MDDSRFSVSPRQLYDRISSAAAPLASDLRRSAALDDDPLTLAGAIRRTQLEAGCGLRRMMWQTCR